MPLLSPPTSPTGPTSTAIGAFEHSTLASNHGLRKRKADLLVPNDSPLTKRFRKLNLREPSKVTKRVGSPARNNSLTNLHSIREPWNLTPPPFQRPSSPPPAMDMDDTPHKIYVNDLDSSDDDSDSSRKTNGKNPIIFLCDVEREMSKIPMAVLKASASPSASSPAPAKLPTARAGSGSSTDLILYRPPEKVMDDSAAAKRILVDAKERFRNSGRGSTMEGIKSTSLLDSSAGVMGQLGRGFTDSPMSFIPSTPGNDPDAMVLDDL